MKEFLRSLALVVSGAVMLCGIGIAFAGAGAPKAGAPCPGCPQAAADNAAAAMTNQMKAHLDGMKSAVAALRESEKTLAGTEDPKAFRAAVIDHLKKLDDLQASHLTHMESMMGRTHGGKPGHCKDCRCQGDGDCRCDCGKKGGGHSH